ncbi:MAG: hypothetical protein N2654_02265 [Deltaproteobacteria bacterium]|nr:hypothetical protein [Deltaproteobacteria bacterium]
MKYKSRQIALGFVYGLHAILFIKLFWLSDDAFIVFRTIKNFLEGQGLVFNAHERVQAYTSPLWLFYLVPFFWMFDTPGFSAFFAHLVLLFCFLRVFFNENVSAITIVASGILLALCNAYTEYTSSGLENLLLYFLVIKLFAKTENQEFNWLFFLLAGFVFLTRFDAFLFCLYPLFEALRKLGARRFLKGLVMLFPVVIWIAFSTLYYGFPFPNTYYAKLSTGIPFTQYVMQGFVYLIDLVMHDPVSAFVMVFFIACYVKKNLPLVLTVLIHMGYVVSIGGDFQTGRFLGTEVVISCFYIQRLIGALNRNSLVLITSICILLNLANKYSVFDFDQKWEDIVIRQSGIAPERLWYVIRDRSFDNFRRDHPLFFEDPWKVSQESAPVIVEDTAGLLSYIAPKTHFIDVFALTDPLLSKLPVIDTKNWRIGHFSRRLPLGYLKTLETKENHLAEESLRNYYDQLLLVVRGRIFSLERMLAIMRLNGGVLDKYLEPAKGFRAQETTCQSAQVDLNRIAKYRYADLIEVFPVGLQVRCLNYSRQSLRIYFSGPAKLSLKSGDNSLFYYLLEPSDKNVIAVGPHQFHAVTIKLPFEIFPQDMILEFKPTEDRFLFFGLE